MNLIPKDTLITEQLKIRRRFVEMVYAWARLENQNLRKIDTDLLLQVSGVRCHYSGPALAGFELIDTEQYLVFLFRWSGGHKN